MEDTHSPHLAEFVVLIRTQLLEALEELTAQMDVALHEREVDKCIKRV